MRQVGAHHLLGVDHRLGHAGAARGEQEFADRLGIDLLDRARDGVGRPGGHKLAPRQRLHLRRRLVDMHQQHALEVQRRQRAGIDLAVLHEHQAGLHEVEDVAQLGVVLAHHRVGRRHRRQRRARLHGGHREQRELDGVRGQDHHRLVRPEAAIDQRLGHGIDLPLGLGIGDFQPLALRPAALRQPDPVRRLLRPLRQEGRHVLFVGLQLVIRLQQDGAIAAPVDPDVAAQEVDRLEGRLHHTVQRRYSRCCLACAD